MDKPNIMAQDTETGFVGLKRKFPLNVKTERLNVKGRLFD
jgi:hypothetical protein